MISKKLFLSVVFLWGMVVNSIPAHAFGLLVEHALYANNEPAKLVDFEKQGVKNELDIYKELLTQIGATAEIRKVLGDTRVTYEKDRLIATIKDYDTIMRSLMFFQVRDKDLIKGSNNTAFTKFYNQLEASSQKTTSLFGTQSANNMYDASVVLKKVLNNPKSPILQAKNNVHQFVSNPLDAGTNYKDTMFLHAYYKNNDKNRVPASIIETLRTYRQSLINEVATRNFLLGIYARAYLAERAEGNGIGRYLYGYDVVLWDEDPWLRKWNIIGGFFAAITGFWESQWQGLQTISQFLSDLFSGGKSSSADVTVSSKEESVDISSLSYGAATDIPIKPLQGDGGLCTLDNASKKSTRDQYMECIWDKFYSSKKGDEAVIYSLSGKEKSEMRVITANIRQMLSINTIMWVRASLELSNLILLSAAELEMEAVLATTITDNFWINPASYETWGDKICPVSTDKDDAADGTSWLQDCLTEKERLWLTPSFDWDKAVKDGSK